MPRFAKGFFEPKNPLKYVGNKKIQYKSSWELRFMMFLDSNPSIQKWASEAISIPYRDPLTNRQTIYVPDFFVQYVDKLGQIHVELIEIKPASQTILERVGKNPVNQAQFVKNQAKWAQARIWCQANRIQFRVLCENDLFAQTK